jgi:hypothetical protein
MLLQEKIQVTKDMRHNLFSNDPSQKALSLEPQEVSFRNIIVYGHNQISCKSMDDVNLSCKNM